MDYVTPTRRNIGNAVALLTQTQLALVEDLKDIDLEPTPSLPAISVPVAQELSSRVFVVHGHDEGTRETVARFLMQLGFE
ncbi:nucleotide-binding protein, partial [Pseudomonas grimontii]